MMKITFKNFNESTQMKVEGRLAGPWVEELERTWHSVTSSATGKHVVLDLGEMTFIDGDGRRLLSEMHEAGVELIGDGIMTRFLIDGIKRNGNGNYGKGRHLREVGGTQEKATLR